MKIRLMKRDREAPVGNFYTVFDVFRFKENELTV